MAEEHNISEKVKQYLERKLKDCRQKLVKLKRKRKRIIILYVTTVVSSIITRLRKFMQMHILFLKAYFNFFYISMQLMTFLIIW